MYASAVSQNVHPLSYTASNTYEHARVSEIDRPRDHRTRTRLEAGLVALHSAGAVERGHSHCTEAEGGHVRVGDLASWEGR
jgi:hypothetical protein